jgi:outer membrane lipoprotein-sorting protein
MPARLVSLLLVLLAVPAVSQQSSIEERISQRIQDHEQKIRG